MIRGRRYINRKFPVRDYRLHRTALSAQQGEPVSGSPSFVSDGVSTWQIPSIEEGGLITVRETERL